MGFAYYDCKIAYGPVSATNINQFTMIDENCIFPIFTGADTPTAGEYTYSEFAAMMNDVYGTGYSMMDGVGGGVYVTTGKLWFPNLNNIFGTVNACIDSGVVASGECLWVIIPRMHRVLRGSTNSLGNIASIYTLNNDGSFTRTSGSGNIYTLFPTIYQGQNMNWYHSYGESVDDFKNANNWAGRYTISFNSSAPNTKRSLTNSYTSIPQSVITALFGEAEDPEIPTEDPYDPSGGSEPGGGDGDPDDDSDDIDFPDLPPDELSDTGFITLFNPSSGQMKSLANFLWSGLFDINSWKKLFGDPMQAILGLSQVPVNVPDGGTADVTVGNILTNVPMTKAGARFVSVDCGSITVKKYWGAYIDYAPYTKAEIYLPYIGTRAIDIDDIMGKSVHVRYHVDILNGSCIAYIKCGNSVLYSFAGQCAMSIPITGDNWTNAINGIITMVAAGAGAMAATGGAAAPAVSPPGVDAPASAMASAGGALTAQTAGSIASTAVNSLKPTIQKSGVLGGGSGMLGIRRPYLIITRPRPCIPKGQNKFTGYPSYIRRKLGDVKGYTEIEKIHLVKCHATGPETAEIEQILRGGVIL